MTERPKPEQTGPEAGSLHPAYKAATEDTQILIRFMGNTARIAGFGFQGDLDPFQVLAASWFMRRQAEAMIAAQEAAAARKQQEEEARKRILTADQLPPRGWVGPDSLKGGPR